MTREPIDLDGCRSPDSLKAARRRRRARETREASETVLLDVIGHAFGGDREPASTSERLAGLERARYLLRLFADTAEGRDPLRCRLIARALDDLDRIAGQTRKYPT